MPLWAKILCGVVVGLLVGVGGPWLGFSIERWHHVATHTPQVEIHGGTYGQQLRLQPTGDGNYAVFLVGPSGERRVDLQFTAGGLGFVPEAGKGTLQRDGSLKPSATDFERHNIDWAGAPIRITDEAYLYSVECYCAGDREGGKQFLRLSVFTKDYFRGLSSGNKLMSVHIAVP